jgi:hypothetical protein
MIARPLCAVEQKMRFGIDLESSLGGFDGRCQLLLEVTCETLRTDPNLKLCEGLRLIQAARTAIARLAPGSLETFELRVMPLMRQMLMERFGVSECCITTEVN